MFPQLEYEFQLLERISDALRGLPSRDKEELVRMLELGAVIRAQSTQSPELQV